MKKAAVIDLVCPNCQKLFSRPRYLVYRPQRPNMISFCSRKCADLMQRVIPSRICKTCGKEFRAQSHGHAARGAKFCGIECYAISRTRPPYKCTRCGLIKTSADFAKSNTTKRGHSNICRTCCSAHNKKFHDYPNSREQHFKHGAKRRGFEWSLSHEQFMLFWQAPCHYCGSSIATIGLDRVDSKQGYTLSNVRSCCALCNRMKAALPLDAFLKHCRRIAAKFPA